MLPVREADDAVRAVRRAVFVGDVELLEAEYAQPSAGELVHGGAAHPADPDHDDVVLRHGRHLRVPHLDDVGSPVMISVAAQAALPDSDGPRVRVTCGDADVQSVA